MEPREKHKTAYCILRNIKTVGLYLGALILVVSVNCVRSETEAHTTSSPTTSVDRQPQAIAVDQEGSGKCR